MDLHQKTQELNKKLEIISSRGKDLPFELVEHLEVLDRAVDQILNLLDTALEPRKAPVVVPEPLSASCLAPSNDIRVLLVEDNMVNRKLAMLILERVGCEVHVAENGAEGVEKFKVGGYEAIFMDCQMPVMDGYEATLAIRKLEAGTSSHIPIIAVTANAMKGDKEKCLECGMDDYISKPILPNDLQSAVNRWCSVNA